MPVRAIGGSGSEISPGRVILPNGGVAVADQTSTDRLVQDITRLGNSFAKWKECPPKPMLASA